MLLVAAAAVPGGDLALVVAAAGLVLATRSSFGGFGAGRQLGEVAHGGVAAAGVVGLYVRIPIGMPR